MEEYSIFLNLVDLCTCGNGWPNKNVELNETYHSPIILYRWEFPIVLGRMKTRFKFNYFSISIHITIRLFNWFLVKEEPIAKNSYPDFY